mgnify:CR=1 FL=1
MSKQVKLLEKYDVEIIEERYNPLIGRLEVKLRVHHVYEGTPSRGLIKLGLAKLYGRDANLVYIRSVYTEYGIPTSVVEAHIYDSAERAKKFEPEHIIKRDEESMSKVSEAGKA